MAARIVSHRISNELIFKRNGGPLGDASNQFCRDNATGLGYIRSMGRRGAVVPPLRLAGGRGAVHGTAQLSERPIGGELDKKVKV
jgi:hypothetical protein